MEWTVDQTSGFSRELAKLQGDYDRAVMNLNDPIAPRLKKHGLAVLALSEGNGDHGSMSVRKEGQYLVITYIGIEYRCKIHANGFTFAYVAFAKKTQKGR